MDQPANPYQAPAASGESLAHDAEWHLRRACNLYRWVGGTHLSFMTVLLLIQLAIWLFDRRGGPGLPAILGSSLGVCMAIAFDWGLIRVAQRLPREFDRLYLRARWLGILAGVVCFPPVLAWVAVGSLAKYRELRPKPATA